MNKPDGLKYQVFVLLYFVSVAVQSQNVFQIEVKNSTLVSTDSVLPFWFTANQHGTVENSGSLLNITGINIAHFYQPANSQTVSFNWGAGLVAGWGETSYSQLNRAFAGIAVKGWELRAGLFYDPEKFGGLSVSNGNLARSQHARPYPKIRFSNAQFKPLPFLGKIFSFKAEYDEGFLNDDRFVKNARLHHKSFYLQAVPASTWKITGGFEHFVFWGGTSSNERIGKMPADFRAYLRYILGSGGSEDFPQTDQANKAGNQLGTYQLEVQKTYAGAAITFYLSHPFEDLSGVNWRNWPDNVAGLHVAFSRDQLLVTDILYEFTSTRQQSIRGDWDRQEPDSYFSHGIYRSGYTYYGKMLGSPLFIPRFSADGIVNGMESNRFFAHHFGISGKWKSIWKWKGMLTYAEHEGTVANPYERIRKQLSGIAEIEYVRPDFPFEIGLSFAADGGSNGYRNAGARLSVARKW